MNTKPESTRDRPRELTPEQELDRIIRRWGSKLRHKRKKKRQARQRAGAETVRSLLDAPRIHAKYLFDKAHDRLLVLFGRRDRASAAEFRLLFLEIASARRDAGMGTARPRKCPCGKKLLLYVVGGDKHCSPACRRAYPSRLSVRVCVGPNCTTGKFSPRRRDQWCCSLQCTRDHQDRVKKVWKLRASHTWAQIGQLFGVTATVARRRWERE